MGDSLTDGRLMRTFNVTDDYEREGLVMDVDLPLSGERVIRSLEQVVEWRGKPESLRLDNGFEYLVLYNHRRLTGRMSSGLPCYTIYLSIYL